MKMSLQQAKDEAWETIRADEKVIQQVIRLLERIFIDERATCHDCSKKLLCEKSQSAKDLFGTNLKEQWFSCFEMK